MSSINQKIKRVAYIQEKYRTFVNRPELINQLLEIVMQDTHSYLGKDATLQDFIEKYSNIKEEQNNKIRIKVHEEDLDFITKIIERMSFINSNSIQDNNNLNHKTKNEEKEKGFKDFNKNKALKKKSSELTKDDAEVEDVVHNFLKMVQK